MNTTDGLNILGVVLALGLSLILSMWAPELAADITPSQVEPSESAPDIAEPRLRPSEAHTSDAAALEDAGIELVDVEVEAPLVDAPLIDATGVPLPRGDYGRIASASSIADALLLQLCDPARILAITAESARSANGFRYGQRPTIESLDHLEALISLSPDVLITHNVADARRVTRLREAGIAVFDLGAPAGVDALLEDIPLVAALCGSPERGLALVDTFQARLRSIARHVPAQVRRSALYLTAYGGQLYGGGSGSSYHDVLFYAGLIDRAPEALGAFPQYDTEALLLLDPELIVTRAGMAEGLCDLPGLHALRACAADGERAHILELPPTLIDDPGLGILEAAETLSRLAYDR